MGSIVSANMTTVKNSSKKKSMKILHPSLKWVWPTAASRCSLDEKKFPTQIVQCIVLRPSQTRNFWTSSSWPCIWKFVPG
jgi:hypothetical protein